jgi:hypothetical protein
MVLRVLPGLASTDEAKKEATKHTNRKIKLILRYGSPILNKLRRIIRFYLYSVS